MLVWCASEHHIMWHSIHYTYIHISFKSRLPKNHVKIMHKEHLFLVFIQLHVFTRKKNCSFLGYFHCYTAAVHFMNSIIVWSSKPFFLHRSIFLVFSTVWSFLSICVGWSSERQGVLLIIVLCGLTTIIQYQLELGYEWLALSVC